MPESELRECSVAYCIGAGEDITFDLELLRRGLKVRIADPTPRAISHVEKQQIINPDFGFAPVGLWSEDTTLRLYSPRNPLHVSHSALNLQQTDTWIEAPVVTLATLRERFGDERIDILKLDIEGAEYAVLSSVAEEPSPPAVLCVEFDQPVPFRKTRSTVRDLKEIGYELRTIEGYNVLFTLA